MNKPAAKEPSMDEILSSIRQIIADDDAGPLPSPAKPVPAEPANDLPSFADFEAPEEPEEDLPSFAELDLPEPAEPEAEEPEDEEGEALELSLAQVIEDEADEEPAPALDDADDDDASLASLTAGLDAASDAEDEPSGFEPPDDIAFALSDPEPEVEPEPEPEPEPVSPLPDQTLTSELAEKLVDQTAEAAVGHAFSRLGNLALGTENQTLEGIIKQMLRPMLKEWLDENLPSVVERLVEREIERISRGR